MTKSSSSNADNKLMNLLIFICALSFCISTVLIGQLEDQQSDFLNDTVLGSDSSSSSLSSGLSSHEQNDGIHDPPAADANVGVIAGNNDKEVKLEKQVEEDPNSKQKIISILQQSGVDITPDLISQIPTWGEVISQYGSEPKIIGLETCTNFQTIVPVEDAYIGPSGIFNTGTNLFADLLLKYCELPKRKVSEERKRSFGAPERMKSGMLWHVPWGKHNPISWRLNHKATVGGHGVEQKHVLPVVTIKDPYHWIGSMCRHPYAANWQHTKHNCPNLLKKTTGGVKIPNKVVVPYRQDKPGHYESLVGLWNTWYGDYYEITDFPRLIIRFEDILFHFEKVMTQVCHCGGGTLKNYEQDGFVLQEKNAKAGHNNGSNGLVAAVLRYGHTDKRTEHFTEDDLAYAKKTLRKDLVELFGYSMPAATSSEQ